MRFGVIFGPGGADELMMLIYVPAKVTLGRGCKCAQMTFKAFLVGVSVQWRDIGLGCIFGCILSPLPEMSSPTDVLDVASSVSIRSLPL